MIFPLRYLVLCSVFFLFTISGCDDPITPGFQEVDFSTVPDPMDTTGAERVELENGLAYYIVEEGEGSATVVGRDVVRFFVTLRIKESGEIIQSTYANGNETPDQSQISTLNTLGFQIGMTGVEDEGAPGMREGESRVLIVPPHLGFADASQGDRFYEHRDETLVYDIELVEIVQ